MFLKHFIINPSSFNVCTKFRSNWSPIKEESTIMIIHYVHPSKTGIFPVSNGISVLDILYPRLIHLVQT